MELVLFLEHDVLELEIPVDDLPFVDVLHGAYQLLENDPCLVLVDSFALFEHLEEVPALQILHDEDLLCG